MRRFVACTILLCCVAAVAAVMAASTSPKRRAVSTEGFPAILASAGKKKYGDQLNFELGYTDQGSHVTVTSKFCHLHPPAGIVSRTRIVVSEDGTFTFQVLLCCKENGKLTTVDEFLNLCERITSNEYKFCPGIDPDVYMSKYFSKIRYHIKNVRHSDAPFKRVDSVNCLLWHKLAKNLMFDKQLESVPCRYCKILTNNLNQRLKTAVTSPMRRKRQRPTSHCPLKFMSPSSQKKRKENTQRDRSKLLQKYAHTEVSLDDEQHEEISRLVNAIDEQEGGDLSNFLSDAETPEVKEAVNEIWQMDRRKMKEAFTRDQGENSELRDFRCH